MSLENYRMTRTLEYQHTLSEWPEPKTLATGILEAAEQQHLSLTAVGMHNGTADWQFL
jgi:hypothetical protein